MNFPELSPQQETVLTCIGTAEIKGRALREALARNNFKKSGPAFYQMMGRLEEAGYVEGWYEQKIVEGQIIKERTYRMTSKGQHALAGTLEYYRERLNRNPGFGGGLANA